MEGLVPLFEDPIFMNSGLGKQWVVGEQSTEVILLSAAFT